MAEEEGKGGRRPSLKLQWAGMLSFLGGLFLLISFISPYWLASWAETHTEFMNMGLWEFCFNGMRYPGSLIDKAYWGCHHIFSEEYRMIREWLLPGWLIVVQAFMTIALIPAFLSQLVAALVVMRLPISIMLFESEAMMMSCVMSALSASLIFLSLWIFGDNAFARYWLLNPNFNHLSWSYVLALFAMFLLLGATAAYYVEYRKSKRRPRSRTPTEGRSESGFNAALHI
ncbi:unnamed protein product [Cyprideis torosa]|uniref:Uncharacterized protein n=1 Tax=Cyprideis torosa TaxID=163714 RepID=A0A7R8WK74_9CRUS|nr:unnamed protein product [Cyprideis torosa]CAG0896625.1 unnamed protein product [Cyprideis torosa]